MASKIFAVVGIVLFVSVCLAMPIVFSNTNYTTSDVSKTRCDLVDDWIKPTSEPLATYWEENVGVGCDS